jgi:hypothetical protein
VVRVALVVEREEKGACPQGAMPGIFRKQNLGQCQDSLPLDPEAPVCHLDHQKQAAPLLRVTPGDGAHVLSSW